LQTESVKDAAWSIDWVGAPVQFQRSLCFIMAAANREFRLTAGKLVPVCNSTLINVNIQQQQTQRKHYTDFSNTRDLFP
jgi:hypothetical protein